MLVSFLVKTDKARRTGVHIQYSIRSARNFMESGIPSGFGNSSLARRFNLTEILFFIVQDQSQPTLLSLAVMEHSGA